MNGGVLPLLMFSLDDVDGHFPFIGVEPSGHSIGVGVLPLIAKRKNRHHN
jgi:hypothetical protein